MDSFDDLLGPSRAALEENPFADDPFSRLRSGSPDPWVTPFGATNSTDSTAHHFANSDSFGPYTHAFDAASRNHPDSTNFDPLDSAVRNTDDDDDDEPLAAKLRSPGFRESIPPPMVDATSRTLSDVEAIRPPPSLEDSLPSQLQESKAPMAAPSVVIQDRYPISITTPEGLKTPSKSGSSFASSQTLSSTLAFKSPLDPSTPTIPERPIAGLSIGGEAYSGWQTEEHLSWHQQETSIVVPSQPAEPPPSADEDSDDDKPILQTLQQKQRDAPVGTFITSFLIDCSIQRQVKKDDKGLQPVFVITVDDPQKVGPIRSFTMYTVHTRVRPNLFFPTATSA